MSVPLNFNPRSPCGERRLLQVDCLYPPTISIHALLAESDGYRILCPALVWNFNPRSPCGERLLYSMVSFTRFYFNPRSPCGERPGSRIIPRRWKRFQSTLSLRRATSRTIGHLRFLRISIHALLAESDFSRFPPDRVFWQFQSTLSLRRATSCWDSPRAWRLISIHALLAESDTGHGHHRSRNHHFNPRSPCGERQAL